MKKQHGFTLIELLVVISIIALLVSILMPALSKARGQVKDVVCLSNLHQIGLGVLMYADDNEQLIPRNTGGASDPIWVLTFMPYLGNDNNNINDYREVEIYNCPSYPDKDQTIDYILNSWANNIGGGERHGAVKITVFRRPAESIYITDNENGDWRHIIRDVNDFITHRGQLDVWHPQHLPIGPDNIRRMARTRHKNEGCNNMFFDGHSDWLHELDVKPEMFVER